MAPGDSYAQDRLAPAATSGLRPDPGRGAGWPPWLPFDLLITC
jgi:hypothetical protein